ncbi:MAG: RHS repeat-associated core domain-containing protein [Planctomycetota bacterium]|nr:RHS repeat-associated core domain-containing protein [Planctomycetota bacterium]
MGDEQSYVWDQLNRLRNVEKKGGGEILATATFKYPAYGWQATSQTVHVTAGNTTETRSFGYGMGGELLTESVPNAGTRTYVNGGLDRVMWSKDAQGTNFWLTGGSGSVYAIADAAGNVMERQRFDAFGKTERTDAFGQPLAQSAIGNRLSFNGRMNLEEFGLQYLRNRYYSPTTGRFISADPIGYEGGLNLYNYCGGDPVNYGDPMGLGRWRLVNGEWVWFDDEGDPDQPPYPDVRIETSRKANWWGWLSGDSQEVVDMLAANEQWRRRMEGRPALQKPLGDSTLADTVAIVGNRSAEGTGDFLKGTGNVVTGGVPMLMSNTADAIATGDPDQARAILWGGVKDQGVMIVMQGTSNYISTNKTGVRALDNKLFPEMQGTVPLVDIPKRGESGPPQGFSSVYEYQAAWGKLAVQERTAAFKPLLEKSGYRGEFAFGAYWDKSGNVRIAVASTDLRGYVPRIIKENSTSTGFSLWSPHETHVVGGMPKGFHAEAKLWVTVRPYYVDAVGGAKYICGRQCTPLLQFGGVDTSTPFAPSLRGKQPETFFGDEAILRYRQGQKE